MKIIESCPHCRFPIIVIYAPDSPKAVMVDRRLIVNVKADRDGDAVFTMLCPDCGKRCDGEGTR